MCDTDEKTQAQVAALLCPLLLKAASPSAAVREKVLAILTHMNKVGSTARDSKKRMKTKSTGVSREGQSYCICSSCSNQVPPLTYIRS